MAVLSTAAGAVPGDAVLVAVGPRPGAAAVLGDQRTALGRELGLTDPGVLSFCWVVDFPMFERDEATGEWAFSHNPFSMPQGGLEALQSLDPGEVAAYQYDLVCNGIELSSGAVRNHLPEVMEAAFAIAGYGPERIRQSFPALWNAFHFGPPPHAGIAPGFDRILMLLEDQANLREVIAFPLNQGARDLLMGAPSAVTDTQLNELHLRVRSAGALSDQGALPPAVVAVTAGWYRLRQGLGTLHAGVASGYRALPPVGLSTGGRFQMDSTKDWGGLAALLLEAGGDRVAALGHPFWVQVLDAPDGGEDRFALAFSDAEDGLMGWAAGPDCQAVGMIGSGRLRPLAGSARGRGRRRRPDGLPGDTRRRGLLADGARRTARGRRRRRR